MRKTVLLKIYGPRDPKMDDRRGIAAVRFVKAAYATGEFAPDLSGRVLRKPHARLKTSVKQLREGG